MSRSRVSCTLLFLCFFGISTASAQYNNWAFGFRLGEPSGINARKYFGENHAFDLNIGTFGGLYGTNREYLSGNYRSVGLTIQGHFLWQDRILTSQSIRGYYGFGGQINNRRYYPDARIGTNLPYEGNISIGGSAIAGIEYFVPNKQYSFFLEGGLYVEIIPSPLFFSANTGLGIRFNL